MRKFDIVNALASKYGYLSYLEICTPTTGGTFRQIKRAQLRACHRLVYRCTEDFDDGGEITFGSCDEQIEGLVPDGVLYDLVFVDAWHTYACAQRDLEFALSRLSPGGTMVVHDCAPPNREAAAPEFVQCPWNGVTYCAYIDFVWSHPELIHCTVDTDYGCGVVKKPVSNGKEADALHPLGQTVRLWQRERDANGRDVFEFFDRHRRELLNLVSVDEFLARESITGPGVVLQAARRLRGWHRIESRFAMRSS